MPVPPYKQGLSWVALFQKQATRADYDDVLVRLVAEVG
jgi:hypothetical protein